MKRTDARRPQPSTAPQLGNDAPALPDIVTRPQPQPPTPAVLQLLADAAEDYAQAQHPVAKIAYIEQGIAAHASLVEALHLREQIRSAS
ncbi:hypothetical protein ABZ883_14795 [Streptomyces sp. NPDC046977]|uniref:hypothetical protein n=1 Tax=Streptomyces sp. NPDC046977 TaxID=3154703 RepID=UPI0033C46D6F